jgi:hypothetical protein
MTPIPTSLRSILESLRAYGGDDCNEGYMNEDEALEAIRSLLKEQIVPEERDEYPIGYNLCRSEVMKRVENLA